MITLNPLAIYILEKASVAERKVEMHPNILSANFEVEAAYVRQLLVSMDGNGLMEISKWDDEERIERRLRDFSNPNAFFESVFDAGYVRVSLQEKGREALAKLSEELTGAASR